MKEFALSLVHPSSFLKLHATYPDIAANIDHRELEAFRELAGVILGYTDAEIEQRVNDGALFRVEEPGEDNAS